MVSHSLPSGYRIRKAKFTDLPQLVLQIFASNGLRDYIQLKKYFFLIFITVGLIGYFSGFNLARDAHEYGSQDATNLILPIENILYNLGYRLSDDTKDYKSLLNEIASLIGIVYALFFILVMAIILAIYFISISYSKAWVVEANNKIIASVRFSPDTSKLENIYVKPEFRRRGFASYLIQYIKKQFQPTFFITCHPKLIPFFEHLGFIKDLENQLQFVWGKGNNLIPMYLPNKETEVNEIETEIFLKQIIDKFDIHQANKYDIDDICRINIVNHTMDYFLPFGMNFIWSYNLMTWFYRWIIWEIILLTYKSFDSYL